MISYLNLHNRETAFAKKCHKQAERKEFGLALIINAVSKTALTQICHQEKFCKLTGYTTSLNCLLNLFYVKCAINLVITSESTNLLKMKYFYSFTLG